MAVHIEANIASFDHKWVSITLPQSMDFSLIPLDFSRMIHLIEPLVSGSPKFRLDLTYSKEMTLCSSNCFTAPV